MATITKRGNRWTAQVRRKGVLPRSRTFSSKSEARSWATVEEARIERGEELPDRTALRATSLDDLLARYIEEITPTKRGSESERLRLSKMRRDKICRLSLAALTSKNVAEYRDRRLSQVRPATVHRELALLAHALDIAHREWGIRIASNPVREVKKPSSYAARNRRLVKGELERILFASQASRNPQVSLAIQLALETALRRGELLSLQWRHINLGTAVAYIPATKNGHPRSVPLAPKAIDLLKAQIKNEDRVFSISANALRKSWGRIVDRAKISDLRFHDLRHEAISRFFEMGLSLPEVAMISGHRDPTMLMRYTHLKAADVAKKLRIQPDH